MKEHEINLHTHTFRCRHAVGSVNEYCQKAVDAGIRILGFAEHSAFPDDRYHTGMDYRELVEFRQEVEDAKSLFPQLTILAGLEVDVDPEFPLEFYQKELKERLDLDFMAGGPHFVHDANGKCIFAGANAHHSKEIVQLFAEKTIFLMECGLFDFITHPDMVAGSIDAWNTDIEKLARQVAECSVKTGVPLEINAYGLRKAEITYPDGTVRHPYPWEPFWKVAAEYQVPCVTGSDAHTPEDVYGNLPQVFAFAEKLQLSTCNVKTAEKILHR